MESDRRRLEAGTFEVAHSLSHAPWSQLSSIRRLRQHKSCTPRRSFHTNQLSSGVSSLLVGPYPNASEAGIP